MKLMLWWSNDWWFFHRTTHEHSTPSVCICLSVSHVTALCCNGYNLVSSNLSTTTWNVHRLRFAITDLYDYHAAYARLYDIPTKTYNTMLDVENSQFPFSISRCISEPIQDRATVTFNDKTRHWPMNTTFKSKHYYRLRVSVKVCRPIITMHNHDVHSFLKSVHDKFNLRRIIKLIM